jgi:mannan endo-1,6-alpha-mannosidase
MLKCYTGDRPGDVPGNLPDPYYRWEAGSMSNALVEYWYYTKDPTWFPLVTHALLHQTGPEDNFMPPNQTRNLGNNDQMFWGLGSYIHCRGQVQNLSEDKPQWLSLAQTAFNSQATRWDTRTCGGGLRWQIFTFNNEYTYKNTVTDSGFF